MFAAVWQRKLVFNWLLAVACIYISGILFRLEWGIDYYLPSLLFHVGVLAVLAGFVWFARAQRRQSKETQQRAV